MATLDSYSALTSIDGDELIFVQDDPDGTPSDATVTPTVLLDNVPKLDEANAFTGSNINSFAGKVGVNDAAPTAQVSVLASAVSVDGLVVETPASTTAANLRLEKNSVGRMEWAVTDAEFNRLNLFRASIADTTIVDLPTIVGVLEMFDSTNGVYGRVALTAGVATTYLLDDPGSAFSTTKNTASSWNVYYDTGYKLQNNRGGTKSISILLTGSTNV